MLPDHLSTSYRRYKADTDFFATWLATTAKHCGFQYEGQCTKSASASASASAQSIKLKGRARTLARRAVQERIKSKDPVEPPAEQGPRYTLATAHFVPMAERIASSTKPAIQIPYTVLRILDRAISLRKKVGSMIASDAADEDADFRHSHFVEMLERVRNILKPRMSSQQAPPPRNLHNTAQDVVPKKDLNNIFEALQTEDPLDSLQQAQDSSNSSVEAPSIHGGASYTTEALSDWCEALLAFDCLLHDLRGMRTTLKELWTSYRDRKCEIVAVSLTCNVAVELARTLEEDMNNMGYSTEVLLCAYYAACCRKIRKIPLFSNLSQTEVDNLTHDFHDDLYFWSTYVIMKPVLDLMKESYRKSGTCAQKMKKGDATWVIYSAGVCRDFDPHADRSKMSSREKLGGDRILLSDVMSDMSVLITMEAVTSHDDAFTRGLSEVYGTGKLPFWLLFAAQLFLDMSHILGDKTHLGETRLRLCAALIQLSIAEQFEYQQDILQEPPPPKAASSLLSLKESIEVGCHQDILAEKRKELEGFNGIEIEQHRFHKIHPWRCGMQIFAIRACFHERSLLWVNARSSILACAHLYNALKEEGMIRSSWRDMFLFETIQDTQHLFAGSPPGNPEQYHRRFSLAVLGHSATNFARNQRKSKSGSLARAAAGSRHIEGQAHLSKLFLERYCNPEPKTELKLEDVQKILEANRWLEAECHTDLDGVPRPGTGIMMQTRSAHKEHLKNEANSAQKMSMQDHLRKLWRALFMETQALTFDHLRLHRHSTRVLRAVRDAIGDKLMQLTDESFTDKEKDLCLTVELLLAWLFSSHQTVEKLGLSHRLGGHTPDTLQLLNLAAAAMEKVLHEPSARPFRREPDSVVTRGWECFTVLEMMLECRVEIGPVDGFLDL